VKPIKRNKFVRLFTSPTGEADKKK